MPEPVRFAAIGLDHRHIYHQVGSLVAAGAVCVGYHGLGDPVITRGFKERFPDLVELDHAGRALDDPSVQLIVTAAVPRDRAPLGILAMRHGKDVMSDKPGFTTLGQLQEARRVQAETQRIYSICYSERLEVRSAQKAGELVAAGAVGKVVQTVNLAPHRLNRHLRPDWFFEREAYGGILCDIGSHQVDQFLFYTGSTAAEVAYSAVGNYANPGDPGLEDYGEMILRSPHANGYVRLDWYTPDGLPTWGDGRLTILGTEGYIEARKYVDIGGRPGEDHLFLVDRKGVQRIDCADVELSYAGRLLADIRDRTETAMSQAHCFLASELALLAQAKAVRLTPGHG
jgi:predicted dehydrogenase